MNFDRHWFGLGIKGGGFLGLAGLDMTEGIVFRLDDLPSRSMHLVNVTNLRIGLGLGGSVGLSAIFAFNVGSLWEINGKTLDMDWGINIALPEGKVGGASASLKALKACKDRKDVLKTFNNANFKDLENFRNIVSVMWSILGDVKEGVSSAPAKVVVIDIPEAGAGAELSGFASFGKFEVDKRLLS